MQEITDDQIRAWVEQFSARLLAWALVRMPRKEIARFITESERHWQRRAAELPPEKNLESLQFTLDMLYAGAFQSALRLEVMRRAGYDAITVGGAKN